jgi:hypothetical protein
MSTPINYQSEVQNELAKQGGGIEYYNPRIASRVLNIRARLQFDKLTTLHEHLNHIQKLFSPMWLQYNWNGWPISSGRPEWADPWTSNFLPLRFTMLTDASINTGLTAYVEAGIPLQYAAAPLALPDPTISELSWLLLDGGIAMSQTISEVQGTPGVISTTWADIPMFPKVEFDTTGAGASNLTIAFTSSDANIVNGTIVLDISGLTSGKNVDIIVRDREVYVNNVMDNTLITSATWPMVSPAFDTTVTWTNITNIANMNVKYYEAFSA